MQQQQHLHCLLICWPTGCLQQCSPHTPWNRGSPAHKLLLPGSCFLCPAYRQHVVESTEGFGRQIIQCYRWPFTCGYGLYKVTVVLQCLHPHFHMARGLRCTVATSSICQFYVNTFNDARGNQ